jgi:hypothetical protein
MGVTGTTVLKIGTEMGEKLDLTALEATTGAGGGGTKEDIFAVFPGFLTLTSLFCPTFVLGALTGATILVPASPVDAFTADAFAGAFTGFGDDATFVGIAGVFFATALLATGFFAVFTGGFTAFFVAVT